MDESSGRHDSALYRRIRPAARLLATLSGALGIPLIAALVELRHGSFDLSWAIIGIMFASAAAVFARYGRWGNGAVIM